MNDKVGYSDLKWYLKVVVVFGIINLTTAAIYFIFGLLIGLGII